MYLFQFLFVRSLKIFFDNHFFSDLNFEILGMTNGEGTKTEKKNEHFHKNLENFGKIFLFNLKHL